MPLLPISLTVKGKVPALRIQGAHIPSAFCSSALLLLHVTLSAEFLIFPWVCQACSCLSVFTLAVPAVWTTLPSSRRNLVSLYFSSLYSKILLSIKKWAEDLNRHFPEEDMQMAKGTRKDAQHGCLSEKCKSKPHWGITSHLPEGPLLKRTQTTNFD